MIPHINAPGTPAFASDNSGAASSRYRYYYGVRFVFKEGTSGKFGYLVVPFLISLLAIVAVYFGFVGKAMKVRVRGFFLRWNSAQKERIIIRLHHLMMRSSGVL